MRTLLCLLLAASGCTRKAACKDATVFVTVELAVDADRLEVAVALPGRDPMKSTLEHPRAGARNSFEIDFASYPSGQTVAVEVVAFRGESRVASGQAMVPLGGSCATMSLALTAESEILPADDGGTPRDLTPPDNQPGLGMLGQACQTVGELACSGHAKKLPLVCGADLTWQPNGTCDGATNCDSTPGATQGTCAPIVELCAGHSPGEILCDGLTRQKCGPDLVSTSPVETCSYVCTAAACIGVCAPGTAQCGPSTPQLCDASGQWHDQAACVDQACVSGACVGVCAPGAARCSGSVPQMCDSTGQWNDGACSGGFCNGAGLCGVCTAGTKRCDVNTPQECSPSGEWIGSTDCGNQACVAGSCVGSCAPTAKQCSGNQPQGCSAGGQWQNATACVNQACVGGACVGVCTPGTKSCSGSTPRTCNANGQWDSGSACPYGFCNGAGVCGVCASGSARCSGSTPQYCDGNGQWYSGNSCDYVCSGNGYCTGECHPSTNGCISQQGFPTTPAACDGNGHWQATAPTCCTWCEGSGTCAPATCGYSVCQRVPSKDYLCPDGVYFGENYFWHCGTVNNCNNFGPTSQGSFVGGRGHGVGPNGGGDWCTNYAVSCS